MIHNEKHKMPLIFNRYKKYILWSTLIVLCVLILIPAIHLLRTKLNQQLPQVPLAAGYSNDASQLNLTKVYKVVDIPAEPEAMRAQIRALLSEAKAKHLKVSIAGAQHSMGGHSIYPDGIVLNMLPYKQMQFDPQSNILSIGSGALWQDAIAYLDGYGKSIAVMQSFSNFSIGGSMSVNGHGWQKNSPPLSSSVISFTLMNAQGEILNCSRTENPELFKLALGGYGLFGVILDVKLKVVDNAALNFHSVAVDPADFVAQYQRYVTDNPKVQFAYGRLRISNKHFLE